MVRCANVAEENNKQRSNNFFIAKVLETKDNDRKIKRNFFIAIKNWPR